MPNPVKVLAQGNNSTLLLTHSPATGQYTLENLIFISEKLKARFFRISTRKDGYNIILGLDKKKAYFGRSSTFSKALSNLIEDMKRGGVELPTIAA
ncbi:hypothetical protein OKE68_02200 [Riemerella anatipestifer]|uniref:Uncharacterized protein n=1 Tax=Riemerella anatipestifer TaxID=34085 RepID=A0AAP3AN13_RIEAN|nr:hypothetical protein [Riemerella anatipestifer]MBT0572803.1 hypothetical protein [Riemerella anatipestifer]MCE3025303.1 hypothetical protein [Riemerella anatipestifer]MCU7560908.1 hypothetical protein [Riemerella anatipestifer]MCU7567816.1 hypothetical protein [Riemerella anatipestifer]MCW0489308.1 hypothetical protein [Riemerella anatipestifer]